MCLSFVIKCVVHMLSSKIENAHLAEKTTTTRCGITETATTRNFVLWLFLNTHDAGQIRLGWLGQVRLGWLGQVRLGQVGQDKLGQVRLVRLGQVRLGHLLSQRLQVTFSPKPSLSSCKFHNAKFRVVAVSVMPQRVVIVFSAQ